MASGKKRGKKEMGIPSVVKTFTQHCILNVNLLREGKEAGANKNGVGTGIRDPPHPSHRQTSCKSICVKISFI